VTEPSQPTVARVGVVERDTRETQIRLRLDVDGLGRGMIQTGVGFFDHMLELLARHGLFDLDVTATGDLHTGAHHTVEDVGICLGIALEQALGAKAGIVRYGSSVLPMDETLVMVALDLSGRPHLAWEVDLPPVAIGTFDALLAAEFFQALANSARLTLHVRLLAGTNPHHIVEGIFKAVARALDQATSFDPRSRGVPSTKGLL
jgi:imidazoleglycerol-phosphate dehydratase